MEERNVLLIADDDEMSRRIIKRFLKDTFEILEAEDGEQTMELLHTRRVDGVLLDILMPKMDGLQVLERLRADDALARVGVLVATSTKEQTERAALSLGADDVVSKPYDPVVIRRRLLNVLAARAEESGARPAAIDAEQAGGIAGRIRKYADLIAASRDNPELVVRLAREVRSEAERLDDILR